MDVQQTYSILKEYISEERQKAFEQVLAQRTRYITVVLENLNQPHNFSAVMRSCDCFGIQDLHIIENDNSYETKERVARGSKQWLSISHYNKESNNTASCIQTLKDRGFAIAATSPDRSHPTPSDLLLDKPVALVMGSEWEGISQEVKDSADVFVHTPMYGFTESFNVSVAAALILSRLTERIRKENISWQLKEDEKWALRSQWAQLSVKSADLILKRASDNEP